MGLSELQNIATFVPLKSLPYFLQRKNGRFSTEKKSITTIAGLPRKERR